MNYFHLTLVIATAIAALGLKVCLPMQKEQVQKDYHQAKKQEWTKAVNACQKVAGVNVTATLDAKGGIYCLTQAGKLIATIAEENQ